MSIGNINEQANGLNTSEMGAFADASIAENKVPSGYIEVRLSTEGKLYAPEVFHMRNLRTEDLMSLTVTNETNLPKKVISLLQGIIYEPDVRVRDFAECEVTETLLELYRNYYSTEISEIDYHVQQKDWDTLAQQLGGYDSDAFRQARTDLTYQHKPKISIDLNKVKKYPMPEEFKKIASVKKKNGFTCAYSFPKYGDVLTLQEWQDEKFGERDKKYEAVARMLKNYDDMQKRANQGEDINMRSVPRPTKSQEEEYNEYVVEKEIFLMIALRALHLVQYKGIDVSKTPLEQRMEYAKDPELDYPTFKKISDAFGNVKVGIDHNVMVKNPITGEETPYEFPFSVVDLLSAIQTAEPDETVVEFC